MKDELVSLMAVKEEDNGLTCNILRYATAEHIIDDFEKLLSHIEKEYDFGSFVAFSDNCISYGEFYNKNGFTQVENIKPDYTYLTKKQYKENKAKYNRERFKNDPTLKHEKI